MKGSGGPPTVNSLILSSDDKVNTGRKKVPPPAAESGLMIGDGLEPSDTIVRQKESPAGAAT